MPFYKAYIYPYVVDILSDRSLIRAIRKQIIPLALEKSMGYRLQLGYPDRQSKGKLMDTQIVVVFCLCNDMLKALHHFEDGQCQMTDAEVMTTAIVAVLYFKKNFRLTSPYLCEHGYIPNMLSSSRFNRRLHRIAELFLTLFLRLGEHWKNLNERSVYVIGSYPHSFFPYPNPQ